MSPFLALWKPGDTEYLVTVVGFTEGDAVVVTEDHRLERVRLRDLRAPWRGLDWPIPASVAA